MRIPEITVRRGNDSVWRVSLPAPLGLMTPLRTVGRAEEYTFHSMPGGVFTSVQQRSVVERARIDGRDGYAVRVSQDGQTTVEYYSVDPGKAFYRLEARITTGDGAINLETGGRRAFPTELAVETPWTDPEGRRYALQPHTALVSVDGWEYELAKVIVDHERGFDEYYLSDSGITVHSRHYRPADKYPYSPVRVQHHGVTHALVYQRLSGELLTRQ
jgi:hypothetical protein